MWIGEGPFEPYGYQRNPFLRGNADHILPDRVYRIESRGEPRSTDQFWVVPVNADGKDDGLPAFKTDGQSMYSLWEGWRQSSAAFISDTYIRS